VSTVGRYIGIDYSGAKTPRDSLKGLRVYMAKGNGSPVEVRPRPSLRKDWTRREIAEWLVERLREDTATLVGIDMACRFCCATSRCIICRPIGVRVSMISSGTGQPTRITPMSISCVTEYAETARPGWEIPAGVV
jgi:hypothetical protein